MRLHFLSNYLFGGRAVSPRRLQRLWILALAAALFTSVSRAQDPRADLGRDSAIDLPIRPVAPDTNPQRRDRSSSTSDADDIFGLQQILVRPRIYDPWTVSLLGGSFHTDNVILAPSQELDDTYFRGTAAIGYAPQITGRLFGRASASHSMFLYDEFDVLDFDYSELAVGFSYLPAFDGILSNSVVYAQYGYDRTWESGFGDLIFDSHSLQVGLQKSIRVSRTHALTLGWLSELSVGASDELPRRHEHAVDANYRVRWTPNLSSTIGYRAAYYDYTEFDRNDWNHSISLGLQAQLTDWAHLYASTGLVHNESNIDLFDYDRFDFGGSIGLQIQFGGSLPSNTDANRRPYPQK